MNGFDKVKFNGQEVDKVRLNGEVVWNAYNPPYQMVEYIESTGTQYIDTGVVGNSNYEFDLDLSFTNPNTSAQGPFGIREASTKYRISVYSTYVTFIFSSDYNITTNITADTRYRIYRSDNVCYVVDSDGIKGSIDVGGDTDNSFSGSFYLFAVNFDGPRTKSSMRLYGCTLATDGGIILRDYIPVKLIADVDNGSVGDVGLWDLTNNIFYPNAGSGDFIAGSEI